MPDCSTGAVTIKIISSTSTTSTNGVTLISESDVSVRPLLVVNAISVLPSVTPVVRSIKFMISMVKSSMREPNSRMLCVNWL